MFPFYGSLKDIVPVIENLTRLPGQLMGRALAVLSTLVAVLGWFVGRAGEGFIDWLPFAAGILGLGVAGFFTWRRYRLANAVGVWVKNQESTIQGRGRHLGRCHDNLAGWNSSRNQLARHSRRRYGRPAQL